MVSFKFLEGGGMFEQFYCDPVRETESLANFVSMKKENQCRLYSSRTFIVRKSVSAEIRVTVQLSLITVLLKYNIKEKFLKN